MIIHPPRLYVDMDGVVADFDQGILNRFGRTMEEQVEAYGESRTWNLLRGTTNFYGNLPKMPGADELIEALRPYRPSFLTGCPRGGWAEGQKVRWGQECYSDVPVICTMSKTKFRFCEVHDILLDDREKYRELWEAVGGYFIHYEPSEKENCLEQIHRIFQVWKTLNNPTEV